MFLTLTKRLYEYSLRSSGAKEIVSVWPNSKKDVKVHLRDFQFIVYTVNGTSWSKWIPISISM